MVKTNTSDNESKSDLDRLDFAVISESSNENRIILLPRPPYTNNFSRESLREVTHLFFPTSLDVEVDIGYSTNEDARITPFKESNAENTEQRLVTQRKIVSTHNVEVKFAVNDETNIAPNNDTDLYPNNEIDITFGDGTDIAFRDETDITFGDETDITFGKHTSLLVMKQTWFLIMKQHHS
ncbi:hypothetical protein TNCV_2812021 [Trichonephila clavipes]|nr:hypothetical protein TNCV_2812021 [Trichonephila clavipes]